MNVIISPNIKKQSDRIDTSGNIIDARTKQILKPNLPDYVFEEPAQAVAPAVEPKMAPITNALSIQEQIDQAKENLTKLEELKKLKIAQMKAELELLES